MSLRGAVIEQQAHVPPQLGSVERVGHDEEQVDVLRLRLTRDERSENHPQDQRHPPCGANAETCAHLARRRRIHTSWEVTLLSQRWQRQDPDLRPMPPPGARPPERRPQPGARAGPY
jgi:hypothetical protein